MCCVFLFRNGGWLCDLTRHRLRQAAGNQKVTLGRAGQPVNIVQARNARNDFETAVKMQQGACFSFGDIEISERRTAGQKGSR